MTARISSYFGDGHPSMSDPIVGRKMHTVGNAPSFAIRSIASRVRAIGSTPAMISPETEPEGIRDAQYASASRNND